MLQATSEEQASEHSNRK